MNDIRVYLCSFLLLLMTVGCSSKKKAKSGEGQNVEEVSDDILEDLDGSEVVVGDDDKKDEENLLLDDDDELVLDDEEVAQNTNSEPITSNESQQESLSSAPVEVDTSSTASYTVQKNETLMLIAWKLYGDLSKWRSLANLNGGSRIRVGQVINYYPPAQPFNWRPDGNPYLIIQGDTLGIISNKVYGTKAKWRGIWQNNKPLIRDPNLIYAGFTIYTLNDGDGLASN